MVHLRRVILQDVGPFDRLDVSLPEGADPERADIHLLVGPNGSGKSTLLASVAQCFTPNPTGFTERARSDRSFVAVQTTAGWFGARPARAHGHPIEVDGARLEAHMVGGEARIFAESANGLDPLRWAALSPDELAQVPVRDVVLAYGGARAAGGSAVPGVGPQTDNPLKDAARFGSHGSAAAFAQWAVNAISEAGHAQARGDAQAASERRAVVAHVERALSFVAGSEVRLDVEFRPNVRLVVRVEGRAPVSLDVLPDGLRALLAWLGDVLMRLDRIPWAEPGATTHREFVLLLDEVEAHLHPAWQRRVLPMAERLFPRAQILCSTHSPFVVGSASDAALHVLRLAEGGAQIEPARPSALGTSVSAVLDSVFGVDQEFDIDSQQHLQRFRELWDARLRGDASAQLELEAEATILRRRSPELATIVETELRDLRRRLTGSVPA